MRSALITACLVLGCMAMAIHARTQTADTNLSSDLHAIHAKWFDAFDRGDGAAMDQVEVDNLVLVLPTGEVWQKTSPRGSSQQKGEPATRTLKDAHVRRFGDTAILTGTLVSKSAQESDQAGTTVVFIHASGKWKIASAQWTPTSPSTK